MIPLDPFSSSALWLSFSLVWSRQPKCSTSHIHYILLKPLLPFLPWSSMPCSVLEVGFRAPPFSQGTIHGGVREPKDGVYGSHICCPHLFKSQIIKKMVTVSTAMWTTNLSIDKKLVSWKLKNSKLRLYKPNPDWTYPLPGPWEKQNNSTPYWAMHIPYLARYDSFNFLYPNSHAYGCPGIITCRCSVIPVHFGLCRKMENIQTSWRKIDSDVLFYLCLLFLLFNLLKNKRVFYSCNLAALSGSQMSKDK